jgi:hypothetical protein
MQTHHHGLQQLDARIGHMCALCQVKSGPAWQCFSQLVLPVHTQHPQSTASSAFIAIPHSNNHNSRDNQAISWHECMRMAA